MKLSSDNVSEMVKDDDQDVIKTSSKHSKKKKSSRKSPEKYSSKKPSGKSPEKDSSKKSHKHKKNKKSVKEKKHKKGDKEKSEEGDNLRNKISNRKNNFLESPTIVPNNKSVFYRHIQKHKNNSESSNSRETSIEILYEEKHEVVMLSDSELKEEDDESLRKILATDLRQSEKSNQINIVVDSIKPNIPISLPVESPPMGNFIQINDIPILTCTEITDVSSIPIPEIPCKSLPTNVEMDANYHMPKKGLRLSLKISKESSDLITSGVRVEPSSNASVETNVKVDSSDTVFVKRLPKASDNSKDGTEQLKIEHKDKIDKPNFDTKISIDVGRKSKSRSRSREKKRDCSRSQERLKKSKDGKKKSREKSQSKERSKKTKSVRSQNRSKSHKRCRSKERLRRSEKSKDKDWKSKDRSKSKSRSKDRSKKSNSKERSRRSRSRNRLKRSKNESKSRRSKDREGRSKSKNRSKSRSKDRSKSSKSRERSKRSKSKDRSGRSKSKHRSRRSRSRKSRDTSRKSRSRSRKSRNKSKKSRDRSRKSRNRSRKSRSRSRKSRDRSRTKRSRSRSHERSSGPKRNKKSSSDDEPSFKIDKVKLRQIAIKNALKNAALSTCPEPAVKPEKKPEQKSGGKTLAEITEFIKKIAEGSAEEIQGIIDNTNQLIDDDEMPFIPARTNKDMRNGPILNQMTLQEKMTHIAEISSLFPVSSGNDHKERQDGSTDVTIDATGIAPVETSTEASNLEPSTTDLEKTKSSFTKDELLASKWVSAKEIPGQFTGSTNVQTLSQQELSGCFPIFAKKDALSSAPPLASGIGKLLLKKMGWKEGEGLGKNNEGMTVPLSIDIKTDRKGLVAPEEDPDRLKRLALERMLIHQAMLRQALVQQNIMRQSLMMRPNSSAFPQMPIPPSMFPLRMPSARPPFNLNPVVPNISSSVSPEANQSNSTVIPEISDSPNEKHPVSILTEICSKRHWDPPEFILIEESGPAHSKVFKFKITLNGTEYISPTGFPQKKIAKMEAALVCLKNLGLFPQTSTNN